MQDTGTRMIAEPRGRAHWIAFALLVLAAWVVGAAFHGNWAYAFGLAAVPAVVGFFIVRSGRTSAGLVPRYVAFVAVLCLLVGGDAVRAVGKVGDDVRGGCLDNNPWVAQLERQQDRETFCGCLADYMAWPVARTTAIAFLTFREPTPVRDDPAMTALGGNAANQCAATLLAS